MKIVSATVIKGVGSDKVFLQTDLPEPCWPFKGNLVVDFNAAADTGFKYCLDNLGLSAKDIRVVERT